MKKIMYYSCVMLLLLACKKDFIVENITNKTVTVNGPGNNIETTNNLVTFWWDALDGAEKYNLQVVKPSFNQVAQLVIDTSVAGTKFTLSVLPGNYQWRIKATNAGYSTAFQTFSFQIDTTSDLSQQLVNLISPTSSQAVGSKTITFKWSPLLAAKKYELQINGGVLKDTTLTGTSFVYALPATAGANTAYTWNVKAINASSETQYNTAAVNFTVDLKGPSTPGISSPVYGTSIADTVKLVWTHNGSDIAYDSIYVANDSLFTTMIQQLRPDQSTYIRVNGLSLTAIPPNTYYWWRIKSFDALGNGSAFSNRSKFKVTP